MRRAQNRAVCKFLGKSSSPTFFQTNFLSTLSKILNSLSSENNTSVQKSKSLFTYFFFHFCVYYVNSFLSGNFLSLFGQLKEVFFTIEAISPYDFPSSGQLTIIALAAMLNSLFLERSMTKHNLFSSRFNYFYFYHNTTTYCTIFVTLPPLPHAFYFYNS